MLVFDSAQDSDGRQQADRRGNRPSQVEVGQVSANRNGQPLLLTCQELTAL
jgi:hypothetical protein